MLFLNLTCRFKFPNIPVALFMFQKYSHLGHKNYLLRRRKIIDSSISRFPFDNLCLLNDACSQLQLNYNGRLF